MTLRIRACAAGPLETNAYLVADEATGEAILVDAPPGVTPALIALAAGLQVRRIVVTHGHWDHIADAAALVEATGVPLAAHPLTAARMADPPGTAQGLPFDIAPAEVTETLGEGDEVRVGGHAFRVLHLPGHDPGHLVLYGETDRVLLGGDVVFPGGHGTLEIPGADPDAMRRSLARLRPLPPDVIVYPGHGRPTTLGAEAGWLGR